MNVIIACATAGMNDSGRHKSHGGAFAAVWSMFVVVGLVAGGTYILRRHRTPSAIGVLLGGSFMTSQLYFLLLIMFASYASRGTAAKTADRWFAACAFFIFLFTMLFVLVLAKFRHEIIPVSMISAGAVTAGAGGVVKQKEGLTSAGQALKAASMNTGMKAANKV